MASSNQSLKLDLMIEEGIKSKNIEALLAEKVYKISKKYESEIRIMLGKREYLSELKNSSIRAKNLATYTYELIERLLLDLWNMKNIDIVLNCIREISTLIDSYEKFDVDHNVNIKYMNYKVFYKLISQSFYHSRTLLGISLSSEILKIAYGINEKLDISLEKIDYNNKIVNVAEIFKSNSSNTKIISKEYNFKFSSKKEEKINYSLKISNKHKGGQFGALCTVSDGNTYKSFYVKTYYGYPAKGNLNSEAAMNASLSLKKSSDIIGDSFPETKYSKVDFKELFVYKVLEMIELGPKIHFMINPYLKDGVFLVTENLNDSENTFIEMSKTSKLDNFIDIISKLNNIRSGKYNDKEYESYNALIDLLEIDIVNRIFTLNDFNTDNFGYLIKKKEKVDEKEFAENWLLNNHDFKIIDFISSIKNLDNYIDEEIVHSFLEGNSTTKYSYGSLMYYAINRTNENVKIKKKNDQEKLYFGKIVIDKLEKRFNNNIKDILKNSKKEIIDFIQKNKESIVLTEDYINKGFEDIGNYINGIVTNYETLKIYILNN